MVDTATPHAAPHLKGTVIEKSPGTSTAPSLSVVIPMYREQDNVRPMLEGVHAGLTDYPGSWELIVVDDGSTDETGPRLVEAAREFGPHVRILRFARKHPSSLCKIELREIDPDTPHILRGSSLRAPAPE